MALMRPTYTTGLAAALLCLLALPLLTACASGKGAQAQTGMRADLTPTDLGTIAVMPFSASDPFGMDPEAQAQMLALYQKSAEAELGALGLKVLSTAEVDSKLQSAGRTEELARLQLDRPLGELFESGSDQGALEDERQVLLRELGPMLDARTAFVGRVIYHTDGICPGISGANPTATIVHQGQEASAERRVPCAVSHFEAKLIDMATGRTLWYNRALREVRAANPTDAAPDTNDNASQTVKLVLADADQGLQAITAAR